MSRRVVDGVAFSVFGPVILCRTLVSVLDIIVNAAREPVPASGKLHMVFRDDDRATFGGTVFGLPGDVKSVFQKVLIPALFGGRHGRDRPKCIGMSRATWRRSARVKPL